MNSSTPKSWTLPKPADFSPFHSWRFLKLGRYDPTCKRVGPDRWQRVFWHQGRLCRFSYGADSKRLAAVLEFTGEGAGDSIGEPEVKASLGLSDPGWPNPPEHPVLTRIPREVKSLRLVRVLWPYEALLATVLQQRVSWEEASQNWSNLCRCHGARWDDQCSAPSPAKLLTLSNDEFAALGIESSRAAPCRAAARILADRLRLDEDLGELEARLLAARGIGPWTASAFLGLACAQSDTVPLGDYDLPKLVHFVFSGERDGTDDLMLSHLAPFAGHRFRVIRWLWSAGFKMPRRGPRLATGRGIGRLVR